MNTKSLSSDVYRSNPRNIRPINVEPISFFFSAYSGINVAIVPAFIYFKACVEHFEGKRSPLEKFCKSLGAGNNSASADQVLVESDAAYLNEFLSIASTIPACFVTLILGAWSDRHGRKLPLILTLFGVFINNSALTYSATYVESSSWLLIFAGFVNGITGSWVVLFQMTYSMIKDSYPTSRRFSLRLGLNMGLGSVGSVAGGLIGGYAVERLGYRYVMLVSLFCVTATLLYTVLFVQETLPEQSATVTDKSLETYSVEHSPWTMPDTSSVCDSIGIVPTIWTLVRRRPGRNRLELCLGLFGFFLMAMVDIGVSQLGLLYAKLPPILWPDSLFSYFSAYTTALSSVGVPISILLLKKCLNCHDAIVTMVGLVSLAAKYFLFGLSRNTFELFAAGSLSFASNLVYPGYRSYMVMLVSPEETGRLFALVALVEILGPLVASLVFNNIYPLTISIFPGLTFIIGGVILAVVFLLILYAHLTTKRDNESELEERSILQNPASIQ